MAQADSSLARISRFGTLTTISALGQIVGPVVGGVIIGHTEQPSLPATSSALLVAAWVFVAGLPATALAMRTRIQVSTVRQGKAERVWGLLRRRGMPAALMTSFSAKSGIDLLLVYVPLLGVVVGLTSSQVGILLGISSSGALLARAATPFFVRRIPNLRLTVVATVVAASCLLVLAVSSNLAPMMARCRCSASRSACRRPPPWTGSSTWSTTPAGAQRSACGSQPTASGRRSSSR
jgi:predicted MFS family arabinose efflux permease